MLVLEGILKNYGALRVADGIDLSVSANTALGVIGPNGAGKTTLFNLISGTARPDKGRILVNGKDVTKLDAAQRCRLGIARSYQVPLPFLGMTVFENLLVASRFGGGMSQHEAVEHCADVLRQTGLLAKANRPATSLPLLDRKRLEMARALATRPQLLLLDEIAGGLTDLECAELISTIVDIRRNGVTIVWIEHIVHALLAVVERLAVLNFGAVVQDGDPVEVMASNTVKQIYMGIAPDADAA